jgi:hypothetical protein
MRCRRCRRLETGGISPDALGPEWSLDGMLSLSCACAERDERREDYIHSVEQQYPGERFGCKKHRSIATHAYCYNCASSVGAGTGCFECGRSVSQGSAWSAEAEGVLYIVHKNGLMSAIYPDCMWCRYSPPPAKKTYAQVVKEGGIVPIP